jgi:hypothetical protein
MFDQIAQPPIDAQSVKITANVMRTPLRDMIVVLL